MPALLGRYELRDELGRGGMGVVYAAHDPQLDREVALKVLPPGRHSPRAQARLQREAQTLARLAHPNVVGIYDVGTEGELLYIAMERIVGCSLRVWIAERERAWPALLDTFLAAGRGLVAAHEAGLVHRDFKPDNVLVDERGVARVVDFGLARLVAAERGEGAASMGPESPDLRTLTQGGEVAGTPAYMAPEQRVGLVSDARADQYAFCVALWEALFGVRPPGDVDPATGGGVPRVIRRALARGLATDPARRWPSLATLLGVLEDARRRRDPGRLRRRRQLAVGALATCGLGLGVILGVLDHRRSQERAQAIVACEREAAALGWTEAQAESLVAAFVATGAPNAAQTAEALAARNAEFVAAWSEARRALCLARTVEHDIEASLAQRRQLCLDQRRAAFEAFLAVFGDPSPAQVGGALETAIGPDALERCADDQALMRMPALPEDPEVRGQVADLSIALQRVRVDHQLGEYTRGLATTKTLLARVEALDYAPLEARARYQLGSFHQLLGDFEAAVREWSEAFRIAVQVGDDRTAAAAAGNLAFIEGYQLGRIDAGIRWAELAGVYYERSGGDDPRAEARRLEIMAIMLAERGAYERAIVMYERALALWLELGGPQHRMVAQVSLNLAAARYDIGELEPAYTGSVEALKVFEALYGEDSPRTARVQATVATYAFALGRYDEAERALEAAMAVWREAHDGDAHADLGDGYNTLADVRRAQGRLDEAVAAYRHALELHEQAHDEHEATADTMTNLADALVERGTEADLAEAELLYGRALGRYPKPEEAHPDPEGRGRARYGLARIALARDKLAVAERGFDEALLEFRRGDVPSQTWIARCQIGHAQVARARGREESVQALLAPIVDDEGIAAATRDAARVLLAGE
nr:serine/threonine-protein kinase [Pseudenhygromyxa sp. WMMC2535]